MVMWVFFRVKPPSFPIRIDKCPHHVHLPQFGGGSDFSVSDSQVGYSLWPMFSCGPRSRIYVEVQAYEGIRVVCGCPRSLSRDVGVLVLVSLTWGYQPAQRVIACLTNALDSRRFRPLAPSRL